MSSWCVASEDKARGSQKGFSLWARVHNLYQEARTNNLEELGERNIDMIKGRWKRLNENGNKWVAAYKEACALKRIGMSLADVELEAHAIYEASGSKFRDSVVFNEVMSKHPKWDLTSQDFSRLHPKNKETIPESPKNEETIQESGGSSKRSRTSEDGDYSMPSNLETPSIGCSTIPCPKSPKTPNASESLSNNEVAAEIRALRLIIDSEAEVMSKLGSARIDLELKKEKRKAMKMNQVLLNTLLAKDHLSAEDEGIKHRLMEIVFR
ncbi:uncharacterized protein LOC131015092 isoform X1 [Salvia miltiorrhiza]|uniref:uncharacterized protein LOC131015092 isoform X1 n=1 Tax=Salvia miltiorrhiza TaxID=226208 RepID=UPI0025ABDF36|nr:uncharacterized protein LOC131015092 isoform X1 [Salvia miltiorrhiza]